MNWIGKILDPDNLQKAWEDVQRNKGAAGIDRVTIKRWGRNWQERLIELAQQVHANTYKARKLKQFRIPKKDGSLRTISILTVTDRVLQRAVLRIVDDLFDKTFLECSYGYRSGLGVKDAIPDILKQRDYGKQWVVDADIDNCFPSLNHQLMLKFFKQKINDPIVLGLIKQWMRQGENKPGIGISLGAVISPLLCNIFLHQLDFQLIKAGYRLVRYADDFCVFTYTKQEAQQAMQLTGEILEKLKLKFEPNKTNITHFDNGFDFLGVSFSIISRAGKLLGRLLPPSQGNIFLRHQQYRRSEDEAFCFNVAKAIVLGKLKNQRTFARRISRASPNILAEDVHKITLAIKQVEIESNLNALRGYEGIAARAYFAILRAGLPSEWHFEKRTRRPPKDPANALLSFGYSLLTQNMMTALEVVGLDPYDGFFHADVYGRPALALDLVEEFRSVIVDSVALTLIKNRIITPTDFDSASDGGYTLKAHALKTFLAKYNMRLQTEVLHPKAKRAITYQKCFEVQARQLRYVIEGKAQTYEPFLTR